MTIMSLKGAVLEVFPPVVKEEQQQQRYSS
jgi:hypothetical protein